MVASGDRPSPTEAAAETAPFEKLIISKNKNPPPTMVSPFPLLTKLVGEGREPFGKKLPYTFHSLTAIHSFPGSATRNFPENTPRSSMVISQVSMTSTRQLPSFWNSRKLGRPKP